MGVLKIRKANGIAFGINKIPKGFKSTTLYISEELHLKLKIGAVMKKIPLHDHIVEALQKYVDSIK